MATLRIRHDSFTMNFFLLFSQPKRISMESAHLSPTPLPLPFETHIAISKDKTLLINIEGQTKKQI